MYYRVAIQTDASPTWRWKSTALCSLEVLMNWLRYYQMLPCDRLRIFSSCSQEELNEQLLRENQGLGSSSVPAIQFLQEKRFATQGIMGEKAANGTRANERAGSLAAVTAPSRDESSRSPLDKRREDLECGVGGDHDSPYRFTLPASLPQVLAWVKLLVKVQNGEFQP
jgi:hypothetical protein